MTDTSAEIEWADGTKVTISGSLESVTKVAALLDKITRLSAKARVIKHK